MKEGMKCILSLLAFGFAHTFPLPGIPSHLLAWLASVSLETQLGCPGPDMSVRSSLAPHWPLTSAFIIAVVTLRAVASWFASPLHCDPPESGDCRIHLIARSTCYMNACIHEHHHDIKTGAKIC